jgi:dihydroorotase
MKAAVYPDDSFVQYAEDAFAHDPKLRMFDDPTFTVLPGFCDVHVHFREPGFSYKETIHTGSLAAAHGGYTTVCTMPNLRPVPDSRDHLMEEISIINKDAVIDVRPYGSLTVNEGGAQMADLRDMADLVCGFSDDGHGVQDEAMMEQCMRTAADLHKVVACHCEVNALLGGTCIHDGKYAREHGMKGISSASEYEEVRRDIRLAAKTGCALHICHVSTKESVQLIREAKEQGINVTCETGPHYLLFDESDLKDEGRWKMNPPLREKEDREALIRGVQDGTVDCIATDHAPHSAEEKDGGLRHSLMGVVGLETAFPILYTYLVEKGIITMKQLMDLMVYHPRQRFGLAMDGLAVFDLKKEYVIDPETFCSKGRATPFAGMKVKGECQAVYRKGTVVWQKKKY